MQNRHTTAILGGRIVLSGQNYSTKNLVNEMPDTNLDPAMNNPHTTVCENPGRQNPGRRSGGEILIDGLIKCGVKKIFCVPGESYLAALDALYDRQDMIQVITCRQEGGAAYMAEACAKLTDQPGICFVSRGPGACNAMTGIHTAFQDSTPVLLFIGQVSRSNAGREAFQELDFTQVYGGVAKKVITFSDAGRIPEQLGQAWQVAISGRPGPVVIALPEDMLTDQVVVADREPGEMVAAAPAPQAIAQLARYLAPAKTAIVLCGGAGWTAQASEYLQQFVEKQNLAVATTFRRTDCFDNTHPHYIGEMGLAPNPKLVAQIQSADLLIAIAPRLGDITTSGYRVFAAPDRRRQNQLQKLIHVHVCAAEINSVYRADLGIVSHPESFLKAACTLAECHGEESNIDRSKLHKRGHKSYLQFLNQPRNSDAPLRMDKVAEILRKCLPADAIITCGAGNYTTWAQRHYQFRQPKTQLASTNGSMGYGVPAAIAAKLTRPHSTVVSFSGDGCFLMNGQELATAVQYQLSIIFLIINNKSYATIRAHQQRHYPGRAIATALDNPNFAALAESYGAFGAVVTRTHQFASAFERALHAERAAVIELRMDY